jgi:hypothetical protein
MLAADLAVIAKHVFTFNGALLYRGSHGALAGIHRTSVPMLRPCTTGAAVENA